MDDETLRAVIYRGRPATTGEVAALAHLTEREAEEAVERLRHSGVLGGTDAILAYMNPSAWVAETVAMRAEYLRRSAEASLAEIERAVAGLPEMLRHWSVGEASAELVPILVRHGTNASEDLWFDTARHDSGTLQAIVPDVTRFLSGAEDRIARFAHALSGKDSVRVIIATSAIADPSTAAIVHRYDSAGVELRMLDDLPSWFWIDGEQLALPFEWGESRPTSVLGVRNGVIAGLAGAYFQKLWERAEPVVPVTHPWTPLLRLMRQGVTLETASRAVGVNPRTGRRRVSAAMEHYGVSTLFALGVAWSADSERAEKL
ncbi:hypothetical protein KPL76_10260 [Subtercola sp. PAMC28395]|uniref:hypothetical protein n=1 Tax=Subtercola sp. PAMC28395 TaxID=2846775 RepID=UPI001C0BCEF4|nr:hypothetical protein [Subtercola sp. PAMC28395]QWT23129.1 hypothetical protein KPL76_10260 [Subtercola sp. PAMC28395]